MLLLHSSVVAIQSKSMSGLLRQRMCPSSVDELHLGIRDKSSDISQFWHVRRFN